MNTKVLRLDMYKFHSNLHSKLTNYLLKELNEEFGKDEIEPKFYRDGMYLEGNHCWFETVGRAFKYDANMFRYKMELLNASEHDTKTIEVIQALMKVCKKVVTPKQVQLVDRFLTYRDTKLSKYRYKRIFSNTHSKYTDIKKQRYENIQSNTQ